jgi:hypothetical protein
MRKNRQKLVVLAVAMLTVSSSAFADWQNGQGVIRWSSTDKEKIIYWSNVNPYNGERSLATLATDFNTYKDTSLYPAKNNTPAGYAPGVTWEADALSVTLVEGKSKVVWKNVAVTGSPLSCPQGRTCGEVAQIISKDQCTSRDFSLGLGGGATWTKAKLKYLEAFANVIEGSFSTGFSTCTGTSSSYTCYAGDTVTPSATDTYATIETRAKWGYGRFTPADGYIYEGSNGRTVRDICAAAGGEYRWDTFDGTSFCRNVKNKVYWDKYQLIPTASATTKTCRVVKAGA